MMREYCLVQISLFILVTFQQNNFVQCFDCDKGSTLWECVGLSGSFLKPDGSSNLDHVFELRIVESNTISLHPTEFSLFPELRMLTIVDSVVLTQENLFEHLYTLKELSIIGCNVSESVGILYASNTNITHLRLAKNNISRVTKNLLQHLHRIEEIDLSHNQISSFEDDVFSKMTSLKKLDLSHNDIGRTFKPSVLTTISRCLQCSADYDDVFIKTVDIPSCHISKMIDILWRKFHVDEIIHLNDNPICQSVFEPMVPEHEAELLQIDHIIILNKCPKHVTRYIFLRESCNFGNFNFDRTSARPVGSEETSSSQAMEYGEVSGGVVIQAGAPSLPNNHGNDKNKEQIMMIVISAIYIILLIIFIIVVAVCIKKKELKYAELANSSGDVTIPLDSLHEAAKKGDLQTVRELLKSGIDPNETDHLGDTPLYDAARGNFKKIVRELLKYGANVNITNNDGSSPIGVAVFEGYYKVVEVLIEFGANFNMLYKYNYTLLTYAAQEGHSDIIELLLKNKAKITEDNYGQYPIHRAAFNGHTNSVKVLLDHKSLVDVKDKKGNTPLHYASRKGHTPVVEMLLEKKADVNTKNLKGITPLQKAELGGHDATVTVLLNAGAYR